MGREAGGRDSWLFRMTSGINRRLRDQRYRLFLELMDPAPDESILDVGVTDSSWRDANPLELHYPRPGQITAVSHQDPHEFAQAFPEVRVIVADGRDLPFPDDAYDVGFSNAVVEHVGDREQQRRFVHEMVRTCRRTMISTPSATFPIDPHTLLPFVHWLPRRMRHPVLRWTGNSAWASEDMLNPLTARQLRSLFPEYVDVRIVRQRMLGLTTVLIGVVDRRP